MVKKVTEIASKASKKLFFSFPTYRSISGTLSKTTATTFAIMREKNANLPNDENVVQCLFPAVSRYPSRYSCTLV